MHRGEEKHWLNVGSSDFKISKYRFWKGFLATNFSFLEKKVAQEHCMGSSAALRRVIHRDCLLQLRESLKVFLE